ncbi:MAG: hypothetical protein QXV69_04295 [Sulfolobaceae archaeon]
MKLKLGYSDEEELLPLLPLINDNKFELVKIREDEIKFKLDELHLIYFPLPLLTMLEGIKVISNGAYIINDLGIKLLTSTQKENIKICIKNTNTTEYYLLKLLTKYNFIIKPNQNECDAILQKKDYDLSLTQLWSKECTQLPLVSKLLGSKILSQEDLTKIKVLVRESASLQENEGKITSISKELGLKGRMAIECFWRLCNSKGLCGKHRPILL